MADDDDDGGDLIDFYVSRTGSAAAAAAEVVGVLRSAGYTIFVQDLDIPLGANFIATMNKALNRCRHFIVIFTEDYDLSPFTRVEWTNFYAATVRSDQKRRMIILRFDNVELPSLLSGFVYGDLVGVATSEGRREIILAAAEGRSTGGGAQVFHGVPTLNSEFIGREWLLDELHRTLMTAERGAAIVRTTIKGLGGIGKTALAAEYSRRHAGEYAGVWWTHAAARGALLSSLAELAGILDSKLTGEIDVYKAAKAGLARLTESTRPWLLIYDDVASPEIIEDLTPGQGARLLVTTRSSGWTGWPEIALDMISPTSAVELLLAQSDQTDSEGAARLARDLGYLPLALNLAGSYIKRTGVSFEQYSELLRQERNRLPGRASTASTVIVPRFTSDNLSTGEKDILAIDADVKAFARLICLDDAKPPLSIVLFGDWGSGKSTFMERLQKEIEKLVRPKGKYSDETTSRRLAQGDEPRFVDDIVQIRFNAWHYADASLWASLTAVFFDQLRRGGTTRGRDADYQALIGKVADRVRSLEANAHNAETAYADAEHKVEVASKALDAAQKKLIAGDLAVISKQLQQRFEEICEDKKNVEKLREIGRRLDRNDLPSDLNAFGAAVAEASTIPGKAALIARILIGGGLTTVLGGIAIVLIASIGIGFRYADATLTTALIQSAVGWGGGILAASGALWRSFRVAKPILDGAWTYAKAVEEQRRTIAAEVENKRRDTEQALAELEKAQRLLDDARKPLQAHGEGIDASAPATILRYFLFEDADVRDYDKHVGIVSRARRSFEQLDAIVATSQAGRKAANKSARGGTLSKDEQVALRRYLSLAGGENTLRVPDRIVLYIDDLDRCTHEQVYAVLQAIHLLLAFGLFVVVVGVDVQWIEGAVAKHFEADLGNPEPDQRTDLAAFELERRKRAVSYLEKIFQIPFWLQRLSTHGASEKERGGTYGAYVRELLGANEMLQTKNDPNVSSTARADRRDDPGTEIQVSSVRTEGVDVLTGDAQSGSQTIEAALASVQLEQMEVDLLASSEIGAIASKSPRAVKRLINVYRIIRARLSESELDEFLGRNGRPPLYPIAVFFAAVETGQPIEVADPLYEALKSLNQNERLEFVLTQIERQIGRAKDGRRKALALLREADTAGPNLGPAIRLIDQLCRPKGATVENYLRIARLVRRYSFNRYH